MFKSRLGGHDHPGQVSSSSRLSFTAWLSFCMQRDSAQSSQLMRARGRSEGHPEFENIVPGVFTPVLAEHTKSFNLVDRLSVGVDRIQRNFEPLQRQVELWRKTQITDDTAKLIVYTAFVDGKLEAPPEACCLKSTGCISSRNIRSSRPGPCGACRTLSPALSRSSIRCRSSRQQPSWAAFSHNCRHNQGWDRSGWPSPNGAAGSSTNSA